MKSRFSMCLTAITLLAALAIPVQLAAQDNRDHHHKHHHYKLIDLGTLGGPQSFADGGHGAGNINDGGTAVGVADTTTPDPFYPNFNPLGFFSDPFVHHAFRTNNGALVDLGALPGANSSSLGWISVNGLVVGQSLNGSIDPLTGWPEESAVLWKDGRIINLGTLGGYESGAASVNSHGQIAGASGNAISDPYSILGLGTETRAFLWDEDDGMQDLGTLGGPDAFAGGVNERGQVIGFSYANSAPSSNCPWPLTTHPFFWERHKMYDLGLGGTCGLADAINDRGQVVGFSNVTGDNASHAFFWDDGKLTDIGTLGGTYGEAFALNEAGVAAGQSLTAGDAAFHAFVWKRGVLADLGSLPGYDDSCIGAFGINAKSQVVGQAVENFCAGPGAHAFLWENGHMIDLNVFVPPGSGLTLGDVERINDRGEMFGDAVLSNGDAHAFLLIPCDENHPGVEGCDYSLFEATTPTGVSPAPATENPAALTPGNHMPMGMWNRFRFRSGQRSPSSRTDWSTEEVLDLPYLGCHRGLSEADSNGKLDLLACPKRGCGGFAFGCQSCGCNGCCTVGHSPRSCRDTKGICFKCIP